MKKQTKAPVTPLRWYGSKRRSLNVINRWLPEHVMEYREPFVGGGASFLNARFKYPNVPFWINDKDRRVYCFWKCARDQVNELIDRVNEIREQGSKDTEAAAKIYNEQFALQNDDNELVAATAFLIINIWSFNSLMGPKDFHPDYILRPRKTLYPRMLAAHELLQGVKITNDDYALLLTSDPVSASEAGVVVFLDPPYEGTESYYEEGCDFNFDEFYNTLLSTKYNWMLTHYLRNFWPRAFKIFYYNTNGDWKVEPFLDGANGRREERLIANFDPSSDLWRVFGIVPLQR